MKTGGMVIPGGRVSFRSTERGDGEDLIGLWNDGRVMEWVGFPEGLGYTQGMFETWLEAVEGDSNRYHFVVHSDEVGFCGELYYDLGRGGRRASLDIKFQPQAQGRGLAVEALRGLIRLVFETEAEVEAVWTEPRPENQSAQRLYERCGLKPGDRPADLPPGTSYWALRRGEWDADCRFARADER